MSKDDLWRKLVEETAKYKHAVKIPTKTYFQMLKTYPFLRMGKADYLREWKKNHVILFFKTEKEAREIELLAKATLKGQKLKAKGIDYV